MRPIWPRRRHACCCVIFVVCCRWSVNGQCVSKCGTWFIFKIYIGSYFWLYCNQNYYVKINRLDNAKIFHINISRFYENNEFFILDFIMVSTYVEKPCTIVLSKVLIFFGSPQMPSRSSLSGWKNTTRIYNYSSDVLVESSSQVWWD